MDKPVPYPLTSSKKKYLHTFLQHFTKYVEAFPIQNDTAETYAPVYATQIITRHETGSNRITDQGRTGTSTLFNGTCKILGFHNVRNSS